MKKGTMIGLVVAVLLGICLWQFLKEDYGVGVGSVRWLPAKARNITYIKNDLLAIAEFDIEREPFVKWCAAGGMPLRELGQGESGSVARCLPLLEERGVTPASVSPNEMSAEPNGMGIDWGAMQRVTKEFAAGDLLYEQRWANGGGYSIGYDVKEKRGYYSYSHH